MGSRSKAVTAMEKAEVVEGEKEEAKASYRRIEELWESVERSYMDLAEELYRFRENKWYRFFTGRNGEPYSRFEDFVEERFNMSRRKGWYLLNVFRQLVVEAGVPKTTLKGIPFSKAREIATVVTKSNVEKWLKKAQEKDYPELLEEVKEERRTVTVSPKGNVMKKFGALLSEDMYENVMRAIEHAVSECGKEVRDHVGYGLDLVATAYHANEALTGSLNSEGLMRVLKTLERVYKVSILVVSDVDDRVIFASRKMEKFLGDVLTEEDKT